jgi:xanthine/uracil permease
MNKILGYVVGAAGIVALAISGMPPLQKILSFVPKSVFVGNYLLIASLVIIAVGIALIVSGGRTSRAGEEVPIYEGKKIVGYRRMK